MNQSDEPTLQFQLFTLKIQLTFSKTLQFSAILIFFSNLSNPAILPRERAQDNKKDRRGPKGPRRPAKEP